MVPDKTIEDAAPDFTLKDQNEKALSLSDFRGKKRVVLSFHPLAWTSVCKTQMQDPGSERGQCAVQASLGRSHRCQGHAPPG